MKIELGKTYKTREGKDVRIVCVDRKGLTNFPIIGLAQLSDNSEYEAILTFTIEGKSASRTSLDLVPPTDKYVRLDDVFKFLRDRGFNEGGSYFAGVREIPVKEIPE